MRARMPDVVGSVDRDGVSIAYEVTGTTGPWLVFFPIDAIIHSRGWKAQVPYLSRYARVVTIDPRGNGRSDRPLDPAAYGDLVSVEDTLAVMDQLGIDRAPLVGVCASAWACFLTAARHPDRVSAVVACGPWALQVTPPHPFRAEYPFDAEPDTDEGWAKCTASYWRRDYRGFLEFFAGQIAPEPHSSKIREDFVGWALESPLEVQFAQDQGTVSVSSGTEAQAVLGDVRCPVLVIHGDDDRCQPLARGTAIAELVGGELLVIEGGGHLPMGREPVTVNLAIRDFLRRQELLGDAVDSPAARRFTTPSRRGRRVLYLSSPIGLGHARRDLAVVRELRRQVPGVEVDWLTQEPVTGFLAANGERVHPASRSLASESGQFEECAGEHDLNAFAAVREMDEILVNNFMVFSDLVEREHYDLWAGDEAWDVDHFLHENPELKRTAYAWLTDFVGWLPMQQDSPGATAREAELTADNNAQMLEQVARLPRVRDHALFVGNPEDVVGDAFGPGLPAIRDWVSEHYTFTGYITGDDQPADREGTRSRFGFGDDEVVCVVAVGGSGVGGHLLRRAVEAHRLARKARPELRTVVVTGPRIDPASVPRARGLSVRGFEPNLDRMLAAADLGVVQGGLTTTMELAAAGRPFIYVPLRHHFEQNRHVRHRLDNYGAGHCLTWDQADPDTLAAAMVSLAGTPVTYKPVETDGAARTAGLLAQLL